MAHRRLFPAMLIAAATICCGPNTAAQSFYQQFRSHNASMAEIQPTWMAPLIQSDARLGQSIRLSVSDAHAPGAQIISYGNNHGISLIVDRRFQFDVNPPSFFRNHSTACPDGFGNAGTQVKYRIASGNAEHGNFAVAAIDYHGFAARAIQNGMLSAFDIPKIAAGAQRGRFNVQTTVGAVLPWSNIAAQGRVLEWNITGQMHTTARTWVDLEDNAAFYFGGALDGKQQNLLTPAAFAMIRRKHQEPAHPALVLGTGMQIATSRFSPCSRNFIAEARILF